MSGVTASPAAAMTHGTDRERTGRAFASDVTEIVTNQDSIFCLSKWETSVRDVYLCVHMIQQQRSVEQEERIRSRKKESKHHQHAPLPIHEVPLISLSVRALMRADIV